MSQPSSSSLIIEEIIDKGYSPEDLAAFAAETRGVSLNSLGAQELKIVIEEFKNRSITDMLRVEDESGGYTGEIGDNIGNNEGNGTNEGNEGNTGNEANVGNSGNSGNENSISNSTNVSNTSNVSNISTTSNVSNTNTISTVPPKQQSFTVPQHKSATNPLYEDETFEIECDQAQENGLKIACEKGEIIDIIVSDGKVESNGFFSKTVYSFIVSCEKIGTSVKRTLGDFEWLRAQLISRYSLRYVPPILKDLNINKKENDKEKIAKFTRKLNIFMKDLIKKTIFRTSPLLYEFLELDEKSFSKYKDTLNKKKFELSVRMDNFKSYKKSIKCKINENLLRNFSLYSGKLSSYHSLFSKLDKSILLIVEDFSNLQKHLGEVSNHIGKINALHRDYDDAGKLTSVMSRIEGIFSTWSKSYQNQAELFNTRLREIFSKINSELYEINRIYDEANKFKDEYEDFSKRINKRKEDLFNNGDIIKWGLEEEDIKNINTFRTNKSVCLKKILPKETKLLFAEKQRFAVAIRVVEGQYKKLLRCQGRELSSFFDDIRENNQSYLADAYNLVRMFAKVE